MAKISKNARRQDAHELLSRWGGKIVMRSAFESGRSATLRAMREVGLPRPSSARSDVVNRR